LICIAIFYFNGIEATFQIDQTKISDTILYYNGYISSFSDIYKHEAYQYPFFLKILSWPLNNVLFAVYGQSVVLFLLLDIIVKKKINLLLFIFNHALIYTSVNLFKDNLVLIVGLFAFILIKLFRSSFIQIMLVSSAFAVISLVRGFFGLLLPFSFFPIQQKIKSRRFKRFVVVIIGLVIAFVLIQSWSTINYVIKTWNADSSLQEEKSSPLIALVKIFFGPTPFHYLFYDIYFVQPFLNAHAFVFFVLHLLFYIMFIYVGTYFILNFKYLIKNILYMGNAYLFSLLISLFLLTVYAVAYGSADIRQRALIISFSFIFLLRGDKNIIKKFRGKETIWGLFLSMICLFLTLVG
jgi:hypothetical protein